MTRFAIATPLSFAILSLPTVAVSATLVVGSGQSFTVQTPSTFDEVQADGTLENKSTLTATVATEVNGTLDNKGTYNAQGELVNRATVENQAGATFNNETTIGFQNTGGTVVNAGDFANRTAFDNRGTLQNSAQFFNETTLFNLGVVTNTATGTLTNTGRVTNSANFENFGNVSNTGDLDNFSRITSFGEIRNFGTVTNFGIYENELTGELINEITGEVVNRSRIESDGDITNNGDFENAVGSDLNISALGTFQNTAIGTVVNRSQIDSDGDITNQGEFDNVLTSRLNIGVGGRFANEQTGATNNSGETTIEGTLVNHGALSNATTGSLSVAAGGRLNNTGTGTFENDGIFETRGQTTNNGALTNGLSGRFTLKGGARYVGSGSFDNHGTLENGAGGRIERIDLYNTGSVENAFLINVSDGVNDGEINNANSGILNFDDFVNTTDGVITNTGSMESSARRLDPSVTSTSTEFVNHGQIFNNGKGFGVTPRTRFAVRDVLNTGEIVNGRFADLEVTIGTLKNEGSIQNFGDIELRQNGFLHNAAGGHFQNAGFLDIDTNFGLTDFFLESARDDGFLIPDQSGFRNDGYFDNAGIFRIDVDEFLGDEVEIINNGTFRISAGFGVLEGEATYIQNAGVTQVFGEMALDSTMIRGGRLAGNGRIVNDVDVSNSSIRAGEFDGALSIGGDLNVFDNASFLHFVGQNDIDNAFQFLDVAGTATIGAGTRFDVAFFRNVQDLELGDFVDLLVADTILADLDTAELRLFDFINPGFTRFDPDTDNAWGLSLFDFTDGRQSIRLTLNEISEPVAPVPLPASAWLLLAGLLGLYRMKARKAA